ncbi:hypothetical protein D3C81_2210630 [compost metagenome]
MSSLLTSIETLRINAEPKLRRHRFGKLHGQINELRIVGLFTREEAMELGRATDKARKEAFEATPDAAQAH